MSKGKVSTQERRTGSGKQAGAVSIGPGKGPGQVRRPAATKVVARKAVAKKVVAKKAEASKAVAKKASARKVFDTKVVAPKPVARKAVVPVKASPAQALRRRAAPRPPTRDELDRLDRARMQWQFGDWVTLAAIDWDQVESHPLRGQLALLVGSAHLQLGDQAQARRFLLASRNWGGDREQIARVMVAGVHNVLGRIASIRREESRALGHFAAAVEGAGGDPRLATQARAITEIGRLDLFDQVISAVRQQSRLGVQGARVPPGPSVDRNGGLPVSALGGTRVLPGPLRVREDVEGGLAEAIRAGRAAIVVAGMRHSGSTALFNIIRMALEQEGLAFESFYSEGARRELLSDPDQGVLLVKTHEYRDDVAGRASVVITTRRDLRDAVASAKRRNFPLLQRVGGTVEYAKYNRALHGVWAERSDFEFVYERFMGLPVPEIAAVLELLGLRKADPVRIAQAVANLPTDQYETLLLSPIHVTDPEHILTFRDSLTPAEIERIQLDHSAWLRRYGYALVGER